MWRMKKNLAELSLFVASKRATNTQQPEGNYVIFSGCISCEVALKTVLDILSV